LTDLYFSMCAGTTFGVSKYQKEKHTDLIITATKNKKTEYK
jgi:hypothetical protein